MGSAVEPPSIATQPQLVTVRNPISGWGNDGVAGFKSLQLWPPTTHRLSSRCLPSSVEYCKLLQSAKGTDHMPRI